MQQFFETAEYLQSMLRPFHRRQACSKPTQMPALSKPQEYRNVDSAKIIEQATHAQRRIEPCLIIAEANGDAEQRTMMDNAFDRSPGLRGIERDIRSNELHSAKSVDSGVVLQKPVL